MNAHGESGFQAVITTGACAAMIFNTLPLFLGVAADTHQLSHGATGGLGSLYLGAFGISSAVAAVWMWRVDRRTLALGLFLGAATLLAFAGMVEGWLLFASLVFAVGLLLGALYSLSFVIAGERSNPTRAFAVKLLGEVTLGAALLAIISLFILPTFGLAGMLMAFALTAAVGALCVPWIARPTEPPVAVTAHASRVRTRLPGNAVIGLIALFVFTIGQSALWSFVERRGVAGGFDGAAIGAALSVAALAGGLGSLGAAWLAVRLDGVKPLLLAGLIQALAIALFAAMGGFVTFVAAVNLFMFAWLFALPWMTAAIATADTSGRATSLVAASLAFGSMLGPGLAGQLMATGGFGWLCVGVTLTTLFALAVLARAIRQGPH